MPDNQEFDVLKRLVYGRGRGSGIRVHPRHHAGDWTQRVYSIGYDVSIAEVMPSDETLGVSVLTAKEALLASLKQDDPAGIEAAIEEYVLARGIANSVGCEC